MNKGDIIFALFPILFLISFISIVVFFILKSVKRKKQLDRIEGKLDLLLNQPHNK